MARRTRPVNRRRTRRYRRQPSASSGDGAVAVAGIAGFLILLVLVISVVGRPAGRSSGEAPLVVADAPVPAPVRGVGQRAENGTALPALAGSELPPLTRTASPVMAESAARPILVTAQASVEPQAQVKTLVVAKAPELAKAANAADIAQAPVVEKTPVVAQPPAEKPPVVAKTPAPVAAKAPLVEKPPAPVVAKATVVAKPPVVAKVVEPPIVLRPWRDDPTARHPRGDGDFRVVAGGATIATTMTRLPTVRCDWLIPVAADGTALPTAADVVALFPYPTEYHPLDSEQARDLAQRYGFTVVSISFPGMGEADGLDRSSYYYFPESGSGQAWLEAWRLVRAAAGLPERRLLLFGRSGGGSAAHQFAEAHPEAVEAYAEEAGRIFVERPRCHVPVLILHGEFDYTLNATMAFDRSLRNAGLEPLRVSFRPMWEQRGAEKGMLTHAMHPEHFRLMQAWLAGVADLRLASGGTLPPTTQWPAFAGHPFPDAAAYAAFRATAPPLKRIGTAVVSRPAPTVVAKGLVLLLVDEFSVDPLDVIFDTQMLADDGYVCAAASTDLADPAAALIAALPTADPGGQLPIVIAVQGRPRHLPALLAAAGTRLRGCAAMRHRPADVEFTRRSLGAKHRLVVLASEAEATALQPMADEDIEVIKLHPKGRSDGRIHLDRIQRLSEQCRRWLSEAGAVQ